MDDQDRTLWDRRAIDEGLVLVDKALRHRRPGQYQVQAAPAAAFARGHRPKPTGRRSTGCIRQRQHIQPRLLWTSTAR
jgi:predicted RNA polymerase sigma factor